MPKITDDQLNKKQQNLRKKEQQTRFYVRVGLGAVAALIIIILGIGLVRQFIINPASPVGVVNGETIRTSDYQARVLLSRFLIDDEISSIVDQRRQTLASITDQSMAESFAQQYDQYLMQLRQERISIARTTYDNMVDEALIRQYAKEHNITVTDEEVQEQIRRAVSGQKGATTQKAVAERATAAANYTATAELWTPTPIPTATPTLTATAVITATPIATTPEPTKTPGPTSTPKILSDTDYTKARADFFNTLKEKGGIDEATYTSLIYNTLVRSKVKEALAKTVSPSADQVHARHIMVKTEDEAKKVAERLKAGEDFAKVAKEVSMDSGSASRGGDLGWAPPDYFLTKFAEALKTLQPGQISDPVQTEYGWHIIEVVERGNHELIPSLYAEAQSKAYSDWLVKAHTDAKITDSWSISKAPADPELDQMLKQDNATATAAASAGSAPKAAATATPNSTPAN